MFVNDSKKYDVKDISAQECEESTTLYVTLCDHPGPPYVVHFNSDELDEYTYEENVKDITQALNSYCWYGYLTPEGKERVLNRLDGWIKHNSIDCTEL